MHRQPYVAHALAGALKQPGWISQKGSVIKADVDVGGEDVDVRERRVAEAGNGTAVVNELPDFVTAFAHDLKPVARDGP